MLTRPHALRPLPLVGFAALTTVGGHARLGRKKRTVRDLVIEGNSQLVLGCLVDTSTIIDNGSRFNGDPLEVTPQLVICRTKKIPGNRALLRRVTLLGCIAVGR